jgi:Outer membrane protein beta-barrel domain
MKRICRWFPLFGLLLLAIPFASAQSFVDFGIGFGAAHDSSTGQGIEGPQSFNAFGTCSPSAPVDAYCQATPSLSGFMLGFAGNVLLTKHYGFGMEASFQPERPNYGPLQYRQTFYDFNGVYSPVSEKKYALLLSGGIGGSRTSFSFSQTSCVGVAVCSTGLEPVGNANHFQIHVGVGVQVFLTDHIFVRPEFDFHYVPGLTNQFGSDAVPQGMVWIGYSLGDR